jgi:hypothetical protein
MRKIAIALTLSACSLGMKPLAPGWDGSVEPDCTDNNGAVIADGLGAGLLIGVGAIAAKVSTDASDAGEPSTGADVVTIVGLGGGLVLAVSGLIGESRYKACHEAYAQWRIGGAIGTASVHNKPDVDVEPVRSIVAPTKPAPTQPRGFYCSSTESTGFCVRDKAECTKTRDVSIGAVPDLTECSLTEKAWCFGDRCSPTAELCDAARTRALGPDGQGHVCAETE